MNYKQCQIGENFRTHLNKLELMYDCPLDDSNIERV